MIVGIIFLSSIFAYAFLNSSEEIATTLDFMAILISFAISCPCSKRFFFNIFSIVNSFSNCGMILAETRLPYVVCGFYSI